MPSRTGIQGVGSARLDALDAALTPALQVPGLWGWWDPDLLSRAGRVDGDAINILPDLSGHGFDFIQTTSARQPLFKTGANGINGKGVLLLDGTDDLMAFPTAANGPYDAQISDWLGWQNYTLIFAARTTDANPAAAMTMFDTNTGSSGNVGMNVLYDDSTTDDTIRLFQTQGGAVAVGTATSGADGFTAQTPHIVVVQLAVGSSGNDLSVQVDGVEVASLAAVANPMPGYGAASAGVLTMGARTGSSAAPFKGAFGAIMLYRRALSATEIGTIVGATRTTYGV